MLFVFVVFSSSNKNLSALRPFFFVYDLEIKYEAYTILANALLLNEHLLSSFDPANYAGTVITDLAGRRSISGQLGNFQDDKTILLLRLLYLFTLKGSKSINGHIMACLNMAFTRINAIERKGIPKCQESSIELLKLLYNLIHNYSHIVVPHFRDRVGSLISVLKMTTENVSTNASIHRHICNILLCSPLEQWHRQSAMVASSILVFLQFLLHNEDVNDTQALSEISLLQVIAAGNDDSEVSNLLQSKLTPTSEDRNQILGQSDSLISLMLKATTNLNLKQSRAIIYGILWKTSHESRKYSFVPIKSLYLYMFHV